MQPLHAGVGAALALLAVCFHGARAGDMVRIAQRIFAALGAVPAEIGN